MPRSWPAALRARGRVRSITAPGGAARRPARCARRGSPARTDAIVATTSVSVATATRVGGSAAPTPNSSADATPASHHAPSRPTARPASTSTRPSPTTMRRMSVGARAEGHAHADLVRPRGNGVLDQRVEPEHGEQERDDRAGRQQRGLHPALVELGAELVADQTDAVDHGLGVDAAHRGPQRARQGERIHAPRAGPAGRRAREEDRASRRGLRDRLEHLRHRRDLEALPAHVGDDADDGEPRRGRTGRAEREAPADGVAAGPQPAGHRGVDDRDLALTAPVGRREEPAADQRRAQRVEHVAGNLVAAQRQQLRTGAGAAFRDDRLLLHRSDEQLAADPGALDTGHARRRDRARPRRRRRAAPPAGRSAWPRAAPRRGPRRSPGSTRLTFHQLRRNRPPPASSTTAVAHSAATKSRRTRDAAPDAVVRPPSTRRSRRHAAMAGVSPITRPVSADTATAQASTRTSRRTSASRAT